MRPPSRSARRVARSAAPGCLLPLPLLRPVPPARVVLSPVLPRLLRQASERPETVAAGLRPLSAPLRPLPGFRRGIAFGGADLQGARNFF